jgi:hypothetical protein
MTPGGGARTHVVGARSRIRYGHISVKVASQPFDLRVRLGIEVNACVQIDP